METDYKQRINNIKVEDLEKVIKENKFKSIRTSVWIDGIPSTGIFVCYIDMRLGEIEIRKNENLGMDLWRKGDPAPFAIISDGSNISLCDDCLNISFIVQIKDFQNKDGSVKTRIRLM